MKTLLYVLILILGIPTGIFLSKLCKDELKKWGKRFLVVAIISFILGIGIMFTSFEYKFVVMMCLFFISIMGLVVKWKSM